MDEQLMKILKYLPRRVGEAIEKFLKTIKENVIYVSEIRLRVNSPVSLSYCGYNVMRFGGEFVVCHEEEIAETLQKLCEDSVHTYSETLKDGYVILENGYRIGVCGRAGTEKDVVRSVYGMTSLCIRIPHPVKGVAVEILPRLMEHGQIQSALFYSVPNVGKTTLIRDIAATLSQGSRARRVSLIDTRGEIYMREMFGESLVDVLRGYPRAKGIEIATRTLSPEVIFCDEIGSSEEAKAILSAANSGVPLIATAHADSFENLLKRPNIRVLYDSRIFRYYIGLSRVDGASCFFYDVFDATKNEVLVM